MYINVVCFHCQEEAAEAAPLLTKNSLINLSRDDKQARDSICDQKKTQLLK